MTVNETTPSSDLNEGGRVPIVGVGASAGGFEAFQNLLENLPGRTGLAFVLVQHLDPHHESQLSELLGRSTRMPVLEARSGMTVKADIAYVIPPNSYLSIEQGRLALTPRGEARAPHLAVDHFFRSLAREQGPRGIGVVLSGSGSDGTLGLAEIKAAGGITFAQDPQSARHHNMPRSAIDSGCVDFVLPPDQIAIRLAEIGGHPYLADPDRQPEDDQAAFQRILRTIRSVTGVDFEQYRDTTIKRRMARRMALHGFTNLLKYADFLTKEKTEVESLYRDMLINVTSFFRDPDLFGLLKERVFPDLLRSKPSKQPIRVWVPGCSTGQEAYSIAIALMEFFDEQQQRRDVQIFATDLSEPATLDRARAGIYPETIEAELTPERLRRFFRKEEHTYRIEKSIRDLCVFARQNIAADPPFSHMDLISCRNVLIYMSPGLQKQVLPTFHYALETPGFLVLGSSETVGQNADLFDVVDRTHRVYAKKSTTTRNAFHFATPRHTAVNTGRAQTPDPATSTAANYQKEADRLVVGHYVPPGVLVNQEFEILQFRGETGAFLQPPSGEPTLGLLKMAREGFFIELRNALLDARRTNQPVLRERVRIVDRGVTREITLRILPVRPAGAEQNCYLVLFEETPRARPKAAEENIVPEPAPPGADGKPGLVARLLRRSGTTEAGVGGSQLLSTEHLELARLRHEFAATKEYLQSLSEQENASNEELRSANEEILSSNEELQSTNEELETAKEELQSTNEELTTVNEQLQHRNVELNVVGSDLSNLLSSTGIPVVMVDSSLRIRRLTPAARKVLNMLPTDVGRPFGEIRPSLSLHSLDPHITRVIDEARPYEKEVQDSDGAWWLLRIVPYRTQDGRVEGAVVALLDVDALKRAQGGLRQALDYSAAVVETTHEPLLVLDIDLRVVSANRAFREKFQLEADDLEGRVVYELDGGRWNLPILRALLGGMTAERRNVEDVAIDYEFDHLGIRSLLFNARWIEQGISEPLILLAIEDVTERKRRLEALTAAVKERDDFLAMLSHELRNPLVAIDNAARLVRRAGEEPARVHAIDVLDRQLKHLRRLVDELLDVSRLVHGKITLRREALNLNDAVHQVVESNGSGATGRSHQISVQAPNPPVWVEADPVRLDQILHNLLSNAIKFTGENGRIDIAVSTDDDEGQEQAVIRVRDNGAGIPRDVLTRVFEDFTQGTNAGADRLVGLGLGLALVKRLVELHGGSVEARNQTDLTQQGAEIIVRLPAIDAPGDGDGDGDGDGARKSIAHRILLVDDNIDAAETMETLLRTMGHEVHTVFDGNAAVAAFADFAPEVAIIDVGLPGMSGYEVAREIRARPGGAGVTLIAHTGYAQESDRQRSREAGFDHHMVKPLDWKAFEKVLASARSDKQVN